ncbi:MAG: alpha/beta fold hydrolase [Desulfotalea sp.]
MLEDYQFKSNFLQIDKHKIHYIDEGEGAVIVLVHGNPTWSYYYRRVISLLSKTNRVIAIDHMGCGYSDKPQNYQYTLDNHRKNLKSLLDTLNVGKYSLIVHDWGGAIGIGCAAFSPKSIEKLVVLNTGAFPSKHMPLRISVCRWPIIGELLVRGLNGFAGPATFMAVSKPLSKEVKASYLAPYSNWHDRVAVYNFVRDIPMSPAHRSYDTLLEVEKGLGEISKRETPSMILWGGKDFCFNDNFYNEWTKRLPKAEKVYYKNGGHYILEDEWDDIAPRLEAFFAN